MDQVILSIDAIILELVEDAKSVVSTEGGRVVANTAPSCIPNRILL